MHISIIAVVLLAVNVSSLASTRIGKTGLIISNLKTAYAENPIGLDEMNPQFSWVLQHSGSNGMQQAFQLLVSDDSLALARHEGNMWDTGRQRSAQSVGVVYAGKKLESRKRYYWKVKVWDDAAGEGVWSDPSFFEMGLLDESEWQGDWVGYPFGWAGKVLYFRHVFACEKEVARARLYASGIGYHEIRLNGEKVGKNVLDPAKSDYSKRIYYTTHDITERLKEANVILISVAPGWYGMPKLRLQMVVDYADGTQQRISSSDIRKVTLGPIVRSGIIDGEEYDARKARFDEWDLPTDTIIKGLPNKTWGFAHVVEPPGGKMVSQHQEPIQVTESFHPVALVETSPGVYLLDAGQNMAGWLSIRVKGKAGSEVTMRFAETIYEDGRVNQENLRTAEATDRYTLKGGGYYERWEPAFTYHGFRYVQVEGLDYKPDVRDFTVKKVRSAVADVGQFKSSDSLLNAIWLMVKRTEASNLHSVPTDCPQRDERMGWLNDMTVRIEQAIYNFDMSRFYAKYLADVYDTQDEQGRITDTAPYKVGGRPADPVSASYLLLALKSYDYYGNRQIIDAYYSGLKAWVDYLQTRTKDGIVDYSYYGDWAPPAEFGVAGVGYGAVSKSTPGDLISTGFLYYCEKMISRMAAVLGKNADARNYADCAEKTALAFNRKFWNQESGGYGTNNQACNSFALVMGLADGDRNARTLENLVNDVIAHDYHLTTGNIATKYVLEALTEGGYVDVAYKVATQKTYPSWGYMLEKGATTLWERWEYETGGSMNSHNHPMMGSVGSWLYKYLLGIVPNEEHPGFEQFVVRPYIPSGLDSCAGSYESIRGTIAVSWKKQRSRITLDVTVPGNSSAAIWVPVSTLKNLTVDGEPYEKSKHAELLRSEKGGVVFQVNAGSFRFEGRL
ncbi:alpha-L-rhamnosidase [Parapedobacter composti]|uniref:alpha-L-rhamnosidase n=1 Tax=Parapedobacter composti TaxID=623281 RepID=A0A1I1L1Q7_9SPHI|nr:alpha-L-rhamnosidase [Parapedobacter composti]SFC66472.1 alpha-L-rhamnosidase [Parapedobacter composti]